MDEKIKKIAAHIANIIRFQNQEIIGAENLDFDGPAILAPTHDSMLDPAPLIMATDRKLSFLNRKIDTRVDLWNTIINAILQYFGAIQFDRKDAIVSLRAITEEIEHILANDELLVIYPEGTRKEVDHIQPGVAHYVLKYDLPVVPCARIGKWFKSPRHFVIGEAFEPERSKMKLTKAEQKRHISNQIEEATMSLKMRYKKEE